MQKKYKGKFVKLETEDYYLVHNGNVPNIDGHDTTYINQLIMSYKNISLERRIINLLNFIPAAYKRIYMTKYKLIVIADKRKNATLTSFIIK